MAKTIMASIIGHRGAAGLAKENSLAGFEIAADMGLSWVEADARLCADGSVALFHDDMLTRLFGWPNAISAMSAEQIKEAGIVFLSDLLRLAERRALGINIELKIDNHSSDDRIIMLADAVADVVEQTQYLPPLLMSSFSDKALARMAERLPWIPRGFLFRRLPRDWRSLARDLAVRTIHTRWQNTKPADIAQIIDNGYESYVFTVNNPKRAESLWEAGLAGLFTAHPERFLNKQA